MKKNDLCHSLLHLLCAIWSIGDLLLACNQQVMKNMPLVLVSVQEYCRVSPILGIPVILKKLSRTFLRDVKQCRYYPSGSISQR